MTLTLQHTPQPFPWGSMYYALYSLVGDKRILADVTESATNRFNLLMAGLGYHLHPLWLDQTDTYPTPPEWWAKVLQWDVSSCDPASDLPAPVMPLLLHLPTHALGAAVTARPGLPVVLFDPTQGQAQTFATLADFAASPYGRCTQVYEVGLERSMGHFTSFFGPGLPHVRPTVRLAWEATQGMRAN